MTLDRALATQLLRSDPTAAARSLESLPDGAVLSVLGSAPPRDAAAVLRSMAGHRGSELLTRMEAARAEELLGELGFDDAVDLIRRLPAGLRARFVASLQPATSKALEALVQFSPGTAGALMDSRVMALPEDLSVGEAVSQIRKSPEHVRYNLYVVDRQRRLVGVLNLRELLLADPERTLESIALREVLSIRADADRGAVLDHPAWREAHSLPVVDPSGMYLGAIRYRTWRILEEETSRRRRRRDTTTADALGDLIATSAAGAMGALTDLASRATTGEGGRG